MKSVTQTVQCQKLTNIILKIIRELFKNICISAEERTVKQNLLIITKI